MIYFTIILIIHDGPFQNHGIALVLQMVKIGLTYYKDV